MYKKLEDRVGVIIMRTIFSKEGSFRKKDIINDLEREGLNLDEDVIKDILIMYRDKGFIIEHGSKYSVYRKYF